MTWYYESKPIDENILESYVGFVYCISNLEDNKKYIGKKLLKFRKSKQVKGKKKRYLVDSNWRTYWGSNKNLIADVDEIGEGKFVREILRLCKTKGECNYFEAKFQFELSALESETFYNDWIMVKVHRSHIKKIDFSEKTSIMKLLFEKENEHALVK
jgi:hypothetical protein